MLTFEGDDLACWVHDGRVCGDGAADGVGRVVHVNDDHLRRLPHLLADTDVLIRLHGKGAEPNVGCIDANILELQQINVQFSSTGTYPQTLILFCISRQ